MARTVFYSFHYQRDVMRVQLIKGINALEGQPLLKSQDWEEVYKGGDEAVQQWIDDQMSYKRAVVVLIGRQTASRPWVRYEINRAWSLRKPLIGVRIHGLSSMSTGVDPSGPDPFAGTNAVNVPIFDPTAIDAYGKIDSKATYNRIAANLDSWSTQGVIRTSAW